MENTAKSSNNYGMKPIKSLLTLTISLSSAVTTLASLIVPLVAQAQNDNVVYVCISDIGVPTYTNNTAGIKGCKALSGLSVTTIPAFKPPPSAANHNNTSNTRNNSGPADFPKVDTESQRQRDETGRRPILERELRDREDRCAATRKDLNGGPIRTAGENDASFEQRVNAMHTQVERCNADLAAIRRELNALK
jgi:hypothetical protein